MKKVIYFVALAILFGCVKKEENLGGIAGRVICSETNAGVEATIVLINPHPEEIFDSPDGNFEFVKLKTGEYTLNISAPGYYTENPYTFTVENGKIAGGDITLEKINTLRVQNIDELDIRELNFGDDENLVTLSFYIFNSGSETLEWEIPTPDAPWINSISKDNGSLDAGIREGVVITIDRDLLDGGTNVAAIEVNAIPKEMGGRLLELKATGKFKELPVVGNLKVTSNMHNSKTFTAQIINSGFPTYTERGFVYSLTNMLPSLDEPNVISLPLTPIPYSDVKEFSATAVGLMPNQTYYVRAYAKNSNGTVYSDSENNINTGEEFNTNTTPPKVETIRPHLDIEGRKATLYGDIKEEGIPEWTQRGFVYSTAPYPVVGTHTYVSHIGHRASNFSGEISFLSLGTKYHVRAYVSNGIDEHYGENIEFEFIHERPTVKMVSITNDSRQNKTAQFHGEIIRHPTSLAIDEYGFVYGESDNPEIGQPTTNVITISQLINPSETRTFSRIIENLEVGKTYFVRAYARNLSNNLIYYSDGDNDQIELNFTAQSPIIETLRPENVDSETAYFRGRIVFQGDPIYTDIGFVYGTSEDPSLIANDVVKISENDLILVGNEFSFKVTGLSPESPYYVKSFAEAPEQTPEYGAEESIFMFHTISINNRHLMVHPAQPPVGNYNTASNHCTNLSGNSGYQFSNWILPLMDELEEICNKSKIITFKDPFYQQGTYWSRQPTTTGFYRGVDMLNCYETSPLNVVNSFHFRCVREFTPPTIPTP